MTLEGDLQHDFQKPMATEQIAVFAALGVRTGWQSSIHSSETDVLSAVIYCTSITSTILYQIWRDLVVLK